MSILPIGVRADALTVLVIGGGNVGARKAAAFLEAGAKVRVIDPRPGRELRARDDSALETVSREFTEADIDAADLVIAATDDATLNASIAAACRARRRLCNRADEPGDGSFEMLAVHRSGPLAIGVSAGGVPGAAARIRDELAGRFDQRYGEAVDRLARVRTTLRTTGEWPLVADSVIAEDFCDAVESGAISRRLAQWD